jgi:hypothetical protein
MTFDDFSFEFEKLKRKWPKYFTHDMESDLFVLLESTSIDEFRRFVKVVVWRKTMDPPSLQDFQKLTSHKATEERVRVECGVCDGFGNVYVISPDGYDYWFCCIECSAGKSKHRELPRWNSSRLEQGWKYHESLINGKG